MYVHLQLNRDNGQWTSSAAYPDQQNELWTGKDDPFEASALSLWQKPKVINKFGIMPFLAFLLLGTAPKARCQYGGPMMFSNGQL